VEGIKILLDLVAEDIKDTKPLFGRERHLVGIPAAGLGGGGGKQKTGQILKSMIRVAIEATIKYGFDVAFVTIESDIYAAALQERATYKDAFIHLNDKLIAEADRLVKYAKKDKLVIFIGAGCSMACGAPNWSGLLDLLETSAQISQQHKEYISQLGLLDRANLIRMRLQKLGKNVQEEVARILDLNKYAMNHALLANLPSKEYITTNYDQLLEKAVEGLNETVRVLPYNQDQNSTSKWLLKMHGCVKHPDDIVLTREDYLRYSERNQALAGVVQAMLMTKHMLFVGFSLADDNFHSIASTVRKAMRVDPESTETTAFGTAINLKDNPILEELWPDVKMVHMSSESFQKGARINEIFLDYICSNAYSGVHHLFHPKFDGLLDDKDISFRDKMLKFLESDLSEHDKESSAYKYFQSALSDTFGQTQIFEDQIRKKIINDIQKTRSQ
jgi:hypothetical protein